MRIGLIAAVNRAGIIGSKGKIPWHYTEDLQRFKRLTTDCTVIMGRKTWESLPCRPLPKRRNIVLTRAQTLEGAECFTSLVTALRKCTGMVWIIGGASVYEEGLHCADFIELTLVPDVVPAKGAVFFPLIPPQRFRQAWNVPLVENPTLHSIRMLRF